MKTLIAAFTLAILFGSPALVQLANAAPRMDAAREKAIHECNLKAQKHIEGTWAMSRSTRIGPA